MKRELEDAKREIQAMKDEVSRLFFDQATRSERQRVLTCLPLLPVCEAERAFHRSPRRNFQGERGCVDRGAARCCPGCLCVSW